MLDCNGSLNPSAITGYSSMWSRFRVSEEFHRIIAVPIKTMTEFTVGAVQCRFIKFLQEQPRDSLFPPFATSTRRIAEKSPVQWHLVFPQTNTKRFYRYCTPGTQTRNQPTPYPLFSAVWLYCPKKAWRTTSRWYLRDRQNWSDTVRFPKKRHNPRHLSIHRRKI